MGFGYLFVGYLIAFVLYLTVQAFGVGGLALLIGYGAMMLGLWELTHYNKAFAWAKWTCVPLLCVATYRVVDEIGGFLFKELPFLNDKVDFAVTWIGFVLIIFFHFAMLYGIRVISREVGIGHMATVAIRNAIFVGLYALVYLLTNLVFVNNVEVRKYFVFSLMFTQFVYIATNLILLIGCTKNICAEGEEDVPQKPHRWEWLNKLDSVYERTRKERADQARAEGEAFAERRRQKKANRKNGKKH